MEKQEKGQFNEQIRERTLSMAVEVHKLLANLTVSSLTRPIVTQLIRSSTSVASNFRAATRSRSDAEFYSKICIVVEEIDETQFWLDYLDRIKLLGRSGAAGVFNEVEELVKIFTSIKCKMKARVNP